MEFGLDIPHNAAYSSIYCSCCLSRPYIVSLRFIDIRKGENLKMPKVDDEDEFVFLLQLMLAEQQSSMNSFTSMRRVGVLWAYC